LQRVYNSIPKFRKKFSASVEWSGGWILTLAQWVQSPPEAPNTRKDMKDDLGNRMKNYYEDRYRIKLPRKSYTIIRVDGKAFHTFTRKFERPFDPWLMALMDTVAIELIKELQGAKFAFVQSDEVSVLLTDFEKIETEACFDYTLQKICSISASIATAAFNRFIKKYTPPVNDLPDEFYMDIASLNENIDEIRVRVTNELAVRPDLMSEADMNSISAQEALTLLEQIVAYDREKENIPTCFAFHL